MVDRPSANFSAEAVPAPTSREPPQLSVIIASVNGAYYLDTCLAALSRQRGNIQAEIIVADCCGSITQELVARKYPHVQLLSFPQRLTIPELRAIGIAQSTGELVTITEDHCVPPDDWLERIIAAHRVPFVAIGGAVENAATERLVDWAVFLCEYYRHVCPVPAGVTRDIPGPNVTYKREALAHLKDLLAEGRWESFLHARLEERGFELYSDPSIVIYHRKFFGLGEFISQRYHYGRSFAGMRVEGAAMWRRAMLALSSPLLPPLLIGRIASHLFRRRRHRLIFVQAFPLLALFMLSWTIGELIGYVAGPGDSLIKVE
jgi:glycosyltransferase involved in cell wall biosynthesis